MKGKIKKNRSWLALSRVFGLWFSRGLPHCEIPEDAGISQIALNHAVNRVDQRTSDPRILPARPFPSSGEQQRAARESTARRE